MAATHQRIVICGAGIAGISAAYHLAVVHGCRNVVLVEAEAPLSMTSDKSTEGYRNWWPGPDPAITAYMNSSIDLLEDFSRATGGRINMNRRGYLFASAEPGKIDWLHDMASRAEAHGAGRLRVHETAASNYRSSPEAGFDPTIDGVDLITDRALIREHFPFLTHDTCVVAHARRAGWISAQQFGMAMLEAARDHGVRLLRGRLSAIDTDAGRVTRVHVEGTGGVETLEATDVVLAGGPLVKQLAVLVGIDLPIFAERHFKISIPDTLGIVPRGAPMSIWLDEQNLPWTDEELALLSEDDATRWLTKSFPGGAHARPDGSAGGTTLLGLFNYDNDPTDIVFPLPEPEHYAEITLRGMVTMIPGLKAYIDKGIRPYVDGGYYTKTRENRPLIGPTAVGGVYLSCAYSGFGIMAACAGGDLIARHVAGADLPAYAPAFALTRYQDPAYVAMLETWGDGGQL